MAKRIKLADYVERKRDAGATIIELDGDVEIVVPPAELWPDTAYEAMRLGDIARAVEIILGEEQFATFSAAGGNWRILNGIISEVHGLDVGESSASPVS